MKARKMEVEEILRLAERGGATNSRLIKSRDVVVRDWVRFKCQFGCPNYGQRLTCPPYSPTPDRTRKILGEYGEAMLLEFREDDGRKWRSVNKAMVDLEREVFLAGYPASIGLASGPCHFCEKCNLEGCIHPHLARPSMESCGIDVFTTARNAGFQIEVVKNRKQKPIHFGLLLIE